MIRREKIGVCTQVSREMIQKMTYYHKIWRRSLPRWWCSCETRLEPGNVSCTYVFSSWSIPFILRRTYKLVQKCICESLYFGKGMIDVIVSAISTKRWRWLREIWGRPLCLKRKREKGRTRWVMLSWLKQNRYVALWFTMIRLPLSDSSYSNPSQNYRIQYPSIPACYLEVR